jgi:DNA-binding CsgD family transcriptional regulator/PAS domain-containing protein
MHDLTVLELAGTLYDAASAPARWPYSLALLRDQIRAERGGIYLIDKRQGRLAFSATTAPADAGDNGSGEARSKLDRRLAAALRREAGSVFARHHGRRAAKPRRLADLFSESAEGHLLGLVALNDGDSFCGVYFHRRESAPYFGPRERRLLAGLWPHFGRAIRLQTRLDSTERDRRLALAALDHVATGVIVVDTDGRPRLANGEAEAILADCDGLWFAREGLRTDSAGQSRALLAMIESVAHGKSGNGVSRGLAMTVPRPSKRPPLEVMVAPISATGSDDRIDRDAALVLVGDPERRPRLGTESIAHLYGLSKAEAELAAGLVSGKTLAEIANERERNIETARKTLKRVFAKTDTGRQAELVRRLLTGPVGLLNVH